MWLSPMTWTPPPPDGPSASSAVVSRHPPGWIQEEQREDVVLVLGRVHPAAQVAAALPEQNKSWDLRRGMGWGSVGGGSGQSRGPGRRRRGRRSRRRRGSPLRSSGERDACRPAVLKFVAAVTS